MTTGPLNSVPSNDHVPELIRATVLPECTAANAEAVSWQAGAITEVAERAFITSGQFGKKVSKDCARFHERRKHVGGNSQFVQDFHGPFSFVDVEELRSGRVGALADDFPGQPEIEQVGDGHKMFDRFQFAWC